MIYLEVCNRKQAITSNQIYDLHSIISISTPGDPIPGVTIVNESTRGVLHLQFHDLDIDPGPVWRETYGEPTLFDQTTARAIVKFVRRWCDHGVQTFRIHCDAGHSRSAAVAAALAKYFNDNDAHWWSPAYSPNRLVYRLMLDTLMESEYE